MRSSVGQRGCAGSSIPRARSGPHIGGAAPRRAGNGGPFGWPTGAGWAGESRARAGGRPWGWAISPGGKADNVMVRNDGVAKVLDFGIVRHAGPLDPLGATAPLG